MSGSSLRCEIGTGDWLSANFGHVASQWDFDAVLLVPTFIDALRRYSGDFLEFKD